jgi:hypothetical protein
MAGVGKVPTAGAWRGWSSPSPVRQPLSGGRSADAGSLAWLVIASWVRRPRGGRSADAGAGMAGYRILGPATSGWEKCRRRSGHGWSAPSPSLATLQRREKSRRVASVRQGDRSYYREAGKGKCRRLRAGPAKVRTWRWRHGRSADSADLARVRCVGSSPRLTANWRLDRDGWQSSRRHAEWAEAVPREAIIRRLSAKLRPPGASDR